MKIEALKELIRQEVRSIVKEEVKNCLFEAFSGNDQKVITHTPSSYKSSVMESAEEETVTQPQPTKKFVKYTNNPVLNQILNETTGGVPQEGGLASMMGMSQPSIQDHLTESVVAASPEPVKAVSQALNRDYRALLKAVDKKVSNKTK